MGWGIFGGKYSGIKGKEVECPSFSFRPFLVTRKWGFMEEDQKQANHGKTGKFFPVLLNFF